MEAIKKQKLARDRERSRGFLYCETKWVFGTTSVTLRKRERETRGKGIMNEGLTCITFEKI